MRRIVVVIALLFATSTARADVGLGAFFGDPTGLDLKLGLAPRSGLDLLVGWRDGYYHHLDGDGYLHVTYLVTPIVGQGQSVLVPLRLGIGGAIFGTSNNVDVGVRFPLEVGLRFRSAPLEIYGEIALMIVFVHPAYDLVEGQGGLGIRFYF
jgi:hypothetical protein